MFRLSAVVTLWILAWIPLSAQDTDTSWYRGQTDYLKIPVANDGLVLLTGADLSEAGFPLSELGSRHLVLYEHGVPIPFYLSSGGEGRVAQNDSLIFYGRRNTGRADRWAYGNPDVEQSSSHFSLFTDTTYYWLTTQSAASSNLSRAAAVGPPTATISAHRDTLHLEEDVLYYGGDSNLAKSPLYTRGEGYYWARLLHSSTAPVGRTFRAELPDRTDADSILVTARVASETAVRHKLSMNIDNRGDLTLLDEADWSGYQSQTLRGGVAATEHEGTEFNTRILSTNDFNSNPNRTFVDWIRISYTRSVNLNRAGEVCAPSVANQTVRLNLTAPLAEPTYVLDRTAQTLNSVQTGHTDVIVTLDAAGCIIFSALSSFQRPEGIRLSTSADVLADDGLAADYVIITRPALRESAEQLAAYRGSQYRTRIVYQDDIFDEFDGGRPTPIAIRRFVNATQRWQLAPRFFVFWGDTEHPIKKRPLHEWEVITFGDTPADNWFMLSSEANVLFEQAATGRVPIRSNSQGAFFVDKMNRYENSPAGPWQRRMLLLAGSNNVAERNLLSTYTTRWGTVSYDAPAAMDTLHFRNRSRTTELLDPSLRDTLRATLQRGVSWLNYFGHAAATTWLISLDPPEQFANANRLPVVVSVGCHTGNFTVAPLDDSRNTLAYGEDLVLQGLSGAIAHWGSGSQSTISQPGILTEHLHSVVFADTVRVLGEAVRLAKNKWASTTNAGLFTQHIALQYGLIGDPATQLNIPTEPDLLVSPEDILIQPETPLVADSSFTTQFTVRNQGLALPESTQVRISIANAQGQQLDFFRTVPPLRSAAQLEQRIPLSDAFLGMNTLEVEVDYGDRVREQDEGNNTAQAGADVQTEGLTLLSPGRYQHVQDLALSVYVAAEAYEQREIEFQLDLAPDFSSEALVETSLPAAAQVVWRPETAQLPTPSLVHWRARLKTPEVTHSWTQSALLLSADLPNPTAPA